MAWAPYDFTYHNYLDMQEGDIFDGNGREIKMEQCWLFGNRN